MQHEIVDPGINGAPIRGLGCSWFIQLILAIAFSTSEPVTAEPIEIRQVVLTTDKIPGGAATFGDLRPPSVNAAGAVAFYDGFGGAIYTTAHGTRVGRLIRAVGTGDVPPGILGPFGAVVEPSLNEDGSFAFRGLGLDSSVRGLYVFQRKGKLKRIADASTLRPGTHETFTADGPAVPRASDGGQIAFQNSTASTKGIFRADIDPITRKASLKELVTLEHGFAELPGFEDPLGYAVNDRGVVAMILGRLDFTRGLYVALSETEFNGVVADGDPVPGGGRFMSGFGAVSVNSANQIAFFGDFKVGQKTGQGIFVARPNGTIRKVADTATEVPNHAGIRFNAFGHIHLADDGTVIFRARYSLGGLAFEGIYKMRGATLEVIFDQFDGIVVDGERIALTDAGSGDRALEMFLAPRFAKVTDDGTRVAFLQILPPANGVSRAGIFAAVQH